MVEKGGLIRDEALQKKIVSDLAAFFSDEGLSVCGTFESPIKGAKGNREFFIHLRQGITLSLSRSAVSRPVLS